MKNTVNLTCDCPMNNSVIDINTIFNINRQILEVDNYSPMYIEEHKRYQDILSEFPYTEKPTKEVSMSYFLSLILSYLSNSKNCCIANQKGMQIISDSTVLHYIIALHVLNTCK